MENSLQIAAEQIALALEANSMLLILMGAMEALYRTLWQLLRRRMTQGARRAAWLGLARWLVLGLEFMLAADIVRTVIGPEWTEIGQLGDGGDPHLPLLFPRT